MKFYGDPILIFLREDVEELVEAARQQAEWWDEYVAGRAKRADGTPLFPRYKALESVRKLMENFNPPSGGSDEPGSPPVDLTRVELRPR